MRNLVLKKFQTWFHHHHVVLSQCSLALLGIILKINRDGEIRRKSMPLPAQAEVHDFFLSDGNYETFLCKLCTGKKKVRSSQNSTLNLKKNSQVLQLEYEAYEPMAQKAMKKVCEDIREKWQVENIAIYHRLGIVPVKEASVVIAISSPHRTESLQAVQYAIDTLKSSAPIWKKEVYASEESEWKENKELKQDLLNKRELEGIQNPKSVKRIKCPTLYHTEVPPHLIQVKAGADEITRRINSFIERKREQVNLGNIQDFCFHSSAQKSDNSCARVDALLIKRKDSKSHLRVRRVLNPWGPQTRGIDPGSMGCTNPQDPGSILVQQKMNEGYSQYKHEETKSEIKDSSVPVGVEERLSNAECHLKLNGPVPKDIYVRLKRIEDRILDLEGLSPEYFQFWGNVPFEEESSAQDKSIKKRVYSISELENKLCDLEYKLSTKRK